MHIDVNDRQPLKAWVSKYRSWQFDSNSTVKSRSQRSKQRRPIASTPGGIRIDSTAEILNERSFIARKSEPVPKVTRDRITQRPQQLAPKTSTDGGISIH
jgi:hypothetical protein